MIETSFIDKNLEESEMKQKLLSYELERSTALVSRDFERLDALLADDLIHIHGNGKVEGKAEYLEGVRTKYRFHSVDRSGLKLRTYGSIAVLTGAILQTFSIIGNDKQFVVEGFLTQIWLQNDAGLRQNTYHMQFLKIDGRLIV